MEWFPALRKRLAARGVHLPDPYPYTARTFKGSVLATLLAAILFLIAYAVWEAASYTARSVQRTAFMTIETTAVTWNSILKWFTCGSWNHWLSMIRSNETMPREAARI